MDIIKIESLDLEAQGVAHREDGKVVFVEGALPFEWVSAQVNRRKNNFEQATLTHIHRESNQRVRPKCSYFGLHQGACGGCKMQHLDVSAQVAVKARTLEDNLWHIAKVRAESILAPMQGPDWGYRFRARLSVRYVRKKETVLIGFHERKSRYLTDMESCQILPPHVSDLLIPLRALLASMDARETCPQIELACGQVASGFVTALVLRHLEPLSEADKERLRAFALEHTAIGLEWWLQAKGPDTVQLLSPDLGSQLAYTLPEFGVEMPFKPTDFTQVNPYINQVLVSKALRYLGVQAHERVIDWFCGLGNFTLPLATQAREVLGVEGSSALVERATQNAAMNAERSQSRGELHLRAKIDFVARNLFDMTPAALAADASADRWLIDPPREGGFALVQALAALIREPEYEALRANWTPPKRIVYVSCNPATLARDAEVLVHHAGYRCTHAGVINMFPHTAHVESLAVFDLVV